MSIRDIGMDDPMSKVDEAGEWDGVTKGKVCSKKIFRHV